MAKNIHKREPRPGLNPNDVLDVELSKLKFWKMWDKMPKIHPKLHDTKKNKIQKC